VASPFPAGTCTLQDAPSFAWRNNVRFNVALKLPANLPQDQNVAVSSAVSQAFAEHEKHLQHFMNSILLERLQIEIEIYKLRQNYPSDI
jgi:hypothetical protein